MSDHASAPAALAQADEALRRGDEAAALQALQSHLALPDCAVRLRDWASAERHLEWLAPLWPSLEAISGPEGTISRAVHAQVLGDAAGALALLRPVVGAHPELASAHHHSGRALHNLGRRAEALAALRLAVQLRPDYAEAWYSLAHALRAAGRLDESVAAYRACLQRMPNLRAALLNLGITLSAAERAGEALAPLERLLALDPGQHEARLARGLCLHVLGRGAEARSEYEHVLQRAPGHPQAHFYLGCLLNEEMQGEAAREHLEAALRGNPGDADVLTELAGVAEQANDTAAAARYVAQGLQHSPGHAGLRLEAARLARRAGDHEAARASLLAVDAAALPARSAQQYWFERTLVHDRGGEYEAAMQALEQGNALAARSPRRHGIDLQAFPRRIAELEAWLARGALGARPQAQDPRWPGPMRPAFLVGFPRSGTTLLDTMLDAHPQVASIEERATIEVAADLLCGPRGGFPAGMDALTAADVGRGQRAYGEAVAPLLPARFEGVLLDKLPLRLLRVPLIHRLLPQAPLLFALRHPCDVVLSNVMQQFRPNEAFVHFDTIANAARLYDQVMRAWQHIQDTLPLRVHVVRYEALVAAPEAVLAAACTALGIDFRDDMLDPKRRLEGRGRIQTNSYQQVAEPVYQRAAGRWRHYRRWLEPVLPLLAPHVERLGYALDEA